MTTVVVRYDEASLSISRGHEEPPLKGSGGFPFKLSPPKRGRTRAQTSVLNLKDNPPPKDKSSKDKENDENGTRQKLVHSSPTISITGRVRMGRSMSEPPAPNPDLIGLAETWEYVEGHWDEVVENKGELARILYRKGMLSPRRGSIWRKISMRIPNTELIRCSNEETEESNHRCLYHKLLEVQDFPCEQQISIDISRTFSDEEEVQKPEFQQSMLNVLKAFSHYDSAVGYCQGLSFVVALLLMHAKEELAFYLLARILKGHNLRSFYTEDMRGVKMRMYQMNKLTQTLFPDMYAHLEKLGVSIALVTTPWFMTAFGYQLPLEVGCRVIDVLLLEGIAAYFRIALAILVLCEEEVMELHVDNVMDYFRSDLRSKFQNPAQLMSIAHAVNVSMPQLEQMELEFLQNEEILKSQHTKVIEEDKIVKMLIENHELKEKCNLREKELAKITLNMDTFKTKVENEKIVLVEKLGEALDKLNSLEVEVKQLQEKARRSEVEARQAKLNSTELVQCNFALSQELYNLRKKYKIIG